jgi:hypothetical protein
MEESTAVDSRANSAVKEGGLGALTEALKVLRHCIKASIAC